MEENHIATSFGYISSNPVLNGTITGTSFEHSLINLSSSNGTTTAFNGSFWNSPDRIQVNECTDSIEMIYKQTNTLQLSVWPPRPPEERVFKIVYSCVDGKWNKSEPVYGKINPPQGESYEFEI